MELVKFPSCVGLSKRWLSWLQKSMMVGFEIKVLIWALHKTESTTSETLFVVEVEPILNTEFSSIQGLIDSI